MALAPTGNQVGRDRT